MHIAGTVTSILNNDFSHFAWVTDHDTQLILKFAGWVLCSQP